MVRPFVKGDSLEHRRYGRRFVGVLVLGHVLAAGVVVAMVQLVGTLTFGHIALDIRVWACAVAAVGGVVIDSRAFVRRTFSVCVARQTPKKLMHDSDRPWWLTPLLWGVDTGTMMSTYRVSFSSWVLLFSALLVVAPAWSGLLFGACFGIPLIVNMFLGDPARFGREGDRARIWKPRLAQLAGIGTLLALPIGLILLAGCTTSGRSDPPGRTPSSSPSVPVSVNEVSCATSIFSESDPPDDYNVVAPGVAVPTAPVLQANETRETDRALRLFAKWGLVVRTETAVDLQVGPGWEDQARIQWGWATAASPGVAIHVPACPRPAGHTQWLSFAGGTWVAQPACVPLIVRSEGQEIQVRLGIGTACE